MISVERRDCSARLGRGVCGQVTMPGIVISVTMLLLRAMIGVGVIISRAVIDVCVIISRAVIDVCVARSSGMIMPVRGRSWFGEWVADVVRN